jgi:hypothetical protein
MGRSLYIKYDNTTVWYHFSQHLLGTSRLLLPINVIELVEQNKTIKFEPVSEKLQRLKELFRAEMKRLAEQVLDWAKVKNLNSREQFCNHLHTLIAPSS